MTITPSLETLFSILLANATAKPVINMVVDLLAKEDSRVRGIGLGYVMAAGGKYARYGYATCRFVREVLKDETEIEVWVGSNERLEANNWGIPGLFTIRASIPGGWPLKANAVRNSSFRHVIFLDSDCLPLLPADELITTFHYADTGALFFPDVSDHRKSDWVYHALGIKCGSVPEMEAGQFIIDRCRHSRGVELTNYFNSHPEFFYKHHLGDKDLWALAFTRLGVPYATAPACENHPWGLRHFMPDGTAGFDHLIHTKTTYAVQKAYDGEHAEKIRGYLRDYALINP